MARILHLRRCTVSRCTVGPSFRQRFRQHIQETRERKEREKQDYTLNKNEAAISLEKKKRAEVEGALSKYLKKDHGNKTPEKGEGPAASAGKAAVFPARGSAAEASTSGARSANAAPNAKAEFEPRVSTAGGIPTQKPAEPESSGSREPVLQVAEKPATPTTETPEVQQKTTKLLPTAADEAVEKSSKAAATPTETAVVESSAPELSATPAETASEEKAVPEVNTKTASEANSKPSPVATTATTAEAADRPDEGDSAKPAAKAFAAPARGSGAAFAAPARGTSAAFAAPARGSGAAVAAPARGSAAAVATPSDTTTPSDSTTAPLAPPEEPGVANKSSIVAGLAAGTSNSKPADAENKPEEAAEKVVSSRPSTASTSATSAAPPEKQEIKTMGGCAASKEQQPPPAAPQKPPSAAVQKDAQKKPIIGVGVGKNKTDGGGGGAGAAAAGAAAAAAPKKQFSWDKKKAINKKDYMLMDRKNEVIVKEGLQLQQFLIDGCENCDIFVLDPMATVSVDYSKNCRIFMAPIESSIFIRNCEGCKFVTCVQQFRSRECTNCHMSLFSQTDPIIEYSSGMEFSCFPVGYFSLKNHLEVCKINPYANKWMKIFDFNAKSDGSGLNYSLGNSGGWKKSYEKLCGELVDFEKCTNTEFKEEVKQFCEDGSLYNCVPQTLGPNPSRFDTGVSSNRVFGLFLDSFFPQLENFLAKLHGGIAAGEYEVLNSRVLGLDRNKADQLGSPEIFKNLDFSKGELPCIGLDLVGEGLHEKVLTAFGEELGGSKDAYIVPKEKAIPMAELFFVTFKDDEGMAHGIGK